MIYQWYEEFNNSDELSQGDIIKGCPVPILKDIEFINLDSVKADIMIVDGIVMTQACDLANKKVENIVLCAITPKSEFENHLRQSGKNEKEIKHHIMSIIKGQQNSMHIINKYKSEDFSQDYYIINFKDLFSVPTGIAKEIARSNGRRLRLCPPYREHLSQAFARYFMRVGLPIDIKFDE